MKRMALETRTTTPQQETVRQEDQPGELNCRPSEATSPFCPSPLQFIESCPIGCFIVHLCSVNRLPETRNENERRKHETKENSHFQLVNVKINIPGSGSPKTKNFGLSIYINSVNFCFKIELTYFNMSRIGYDESRNISYDDVYQTMRFHRMMFRHMRSKGSEQSNQK